MGKLPWGGQTGVGTPYRNVGGGPSILQIITPRMTEPFNTIQHIKAALSFLAIILVLKYLNMSNTTTIARATPAEIQHILTDYEIHLTGSENGTTTQPPSLHQNQNQHLAAENPHNWPSNYRRVPDYQPINRELNYSERPLGNSTFEFLFLNVMFTGVATNAVSNQISLCLNFIKLLTDDFRVLQNYGDGQEGRFSRVCFATLSAGNGDGDNKGWLSSAE